MYEYTWVNDPLFSKYFVGFDIMINKCQKLAHELSKANTFPPFNLKKVDDNKYVIELAIAGFSKQDIELSLEDNVLVIKGNVHNNEDNSALSLYQGIAQRAFTRTFSLADSIEIKNASIVNGMLKIWLENIIPESKKPKKIEIQEVNEDAPVTKKLNSTGA